MAHEDLATEDDRLLMKIAKDIEQKWNMYGLSSDLYFEWAAEIALRFYTQKSSNLLTTYFIEHYLNREMMLCSLCGNTGLIDTTRLINPVGISFGRVNFCLCPNGQAQRAGKLPPQHFPISESEMRNV